MHVPIQHIIGTIALIGLLISAGVAYSVITSYIADSIIEQDLKQVSGTVAMNLIEIINLASFENFGVITSNDTLARTIDLPLDVGGKAYAVQLVNRADQNQGYDVTTYLVSKNTTRASSSIPINSNLGDVQLITNVTDKSTYWVCLGKDFVTSSALIYGGANNTVVWATKGSGNMTAGIGYFTLSG